jgi:tRNA(adenine34) deaminase
MSSRTNVPPLRTVELEPGPASAPTLRTVELEPATTMSMTAPLADPADERYMRLALDAAEQAARTGEVPVGAVVVVGGEVVAVAHNERETKNDPTAHAEVVALRRAAAARGSWRLLGADLYVTMEPCPMCAGAIVNARMRRVVYGCDDPKAGAARTLYQLLDDPRLNHRVGVVPGLLAPESAGLLRAFFTRLRRVDAK